MIEQSAGCAAARFRALLRIGFIAFAAALLAMVPIAASPDRAHADGGVFVTDFAFGGGDFEPDVVPPEPTGIYRLVVEFDKNVSWARRGEDDSFVKENLEKVHLVYEDGTPVEGAEIKPAYGQSDRRLIYVFADDWLRPLTTYRVVVDAGIVAANGTDATDQPYEFEFTTTADCENGLTIYENVAIPVVGVLVVAGIAVQVVRTARSRR